MTKDHMAAECLPNMEQKQSTNFQLPICPEEPHFPVNKENVENLKKLLLKQFANSAFKTDEQFPAMSGKLAHIHLKQGAIPKTKHRPIPVPYHLKEGWSAKMYHQLSISEFAIQVRNPPHCLTFPTGNAGTTQYQENNAGCCAWLPLCYIR